MKQIILNTIADLVSDFTFYDRMEDEELNDDQLKLAVQDGTITIDEMAECFKRELENWWKETKPIK